MDNPERSKILFSDGHLPTFILLEFSKCIQQANLFSYLGVHFAAPSRQREWLEAMLPVINTPQARSEVFCDCGGQAGNNGSENFLKLP